MNATQRRQVRRKFKYTVANKYHPSAEDDKLHWLVTYVGSENFKYLDWKRLGFAKEKDAVFFKLKWA